jgi:ABC-type nitrate/sulfonate/bicarbonate transport system substrate-binding protein
MKRAIVFAAAVTLVAFQAISSAVSAQEFIKVRVSRFAFPGSWTVVADAIKAKGIDRKHGIDLEPKSYSTIAAYYGAATTNEVDLVIGGPHVLQRMRNEGVPLKGLFTFQRLTGLALIAADPAIRGVDDLKGRTIAADMGSSEYQLLAIYARTRGVVFGKDVTVVQAPPALARSQLAAKRVDASMTWELGATLMLHDNPQYRIVVGGDTVWSGIGKSKGWQVVVLAHEAFLARQPQAVPRLLAMLQEAVDFMVKNTREAERIAAETVKLPEGVLSEAIGARRVIYEVLPVWGAERDGLWEMFKIAVDNGYIDKLPDSAVLYTPR